MHCIQVCHSVGYNVGHDVGSGESATGRKRTQFLQLQLLIYRDLTPEILHRRSETHNHLLGA